jgi:hypothetical protein
LKRKKKTPYQCGFRSYSRLPIKTWGQVDEVADARGIIWHNVDYSSREWGNAYHELTLRRWVGGRIGKLSKSQVMAVANEMRRRRILGE